MFGGNNFIIIDNNKDLTEEQAQKRFNMLVKKGVSRFIKRPIQNPKGKSWVRKQKMLGENYSELVWNFGKQLILERIDFQQVAKKIMNKYRIRSKLQFSPRATKGDYDFDRDIIKLRPFYESDLRWLKHYGFLPVDNPSLHSGLNGIFSWSLHGNGY